MDQTTKPDLLVPTVMTSVSQKRGDLALIPFSGTVNDIQV